MEPKLRQLIVAKRISKGITVPQLAAIAKGSITELQGYERGLLILSLARVCSLITALQITHEELAESIGHEHAAKLIEDCQLKLA